jgi:CHAP domain
VKRRARSAGRAIAWRVLLVLLKSFLAAIGPLGMAIIAIGLLVLLLIVGILGAASSVTGQGIAGTPCVEMRVSDTLGSAPPGLVDTAARSATKFGQDASVLLAVNYVETVFGTVQTGQPDDLVPADIRAHVDQAALAPNGVTSLMLRLQGGRRIGDWVGPPLVGSEPAMGFMQFLPLTWRTEAPPALGRPGDPYNPEDAMTAAASFLKKLTREHGSLRNGLAFYGGYDSLAYADQVLGLAHGPKLLQTTACSVLVAGGWIIAASFTGQIHVSSPNQEVALQTSAPYHPIYSTAPVTGYVSYAAYGQCVWWTDFNTGIADNLGNGQDIVPSLASVHGWSVYLYGPGKPRLLPPPGSIISYRAGQNWSQWGHVSMVIAVNRDNVHFAVDEMNVIGRGVENQRMAADDPDLEGWAYRTG